MERPLNATGLIWNEEARKPPLSPAALHALQGKTRSPELPLQDTVEETGPGLFSEDILVRLTGAEDALVLNNLYSSLLLAFFCLGEGRQAAALGDLTALQQDLSFSLEELASRSGVELCWFDDPAGTEAPTISSLENMAFVLEASAGAAPPLERPAAAGEAGNPLALLQEAGLPAVKLLQNATLLDLQPFGLSPGLQVQQWVQQGYDLVIFPGDTLLGGPPAGILVGKSRSISLLRRGVLTPAFTPSQITASALEATLKIYLQEGEAALQQIPLLQAISAPLPRLQQRAEHLAAAISEEAGGRLETRLVEGETRVRERGNPPGLLPTCLLELSADRFSGRQLFEMLKHQGRTPVLARLEQDRLLLDLRSMPEEEDQQLLKAVQLLCRQEESRDRGLEKTQAVLWVLDQEGIFLYANEACRRFWGIKARDLPGKSMAKMLPALGETTGTNLGESLQNVLRDGNEGCLELRLQLTGEENPRWFNLVLTPVYGTGDEPCEVICTGFEVTGYKKREEELLFTTMHDSLTGLYNRAYFEEEMHRLDTKRHYPVSIVVFDVDGLELINDILGHRQGDAHIKAAALTIKKPFRDSDVVARVGGDEFAVILPCTGEETTVQICRRLQEALQKHNARKAVPLSLSVGHATGTEPGQIIDVFEQADRNMQEDKFRHAEAVRQEIYQALLATMSEKDFLDERSLQKLERLLLLLGRSIGISEKEMELISLLVRVYDIGKMSIDERILYKQGTLNPAEWEEVRSHPETGYHITAFSPETRHVASYILQHHECWDGSGYPRGLKGANIHLYARMLSIVDAYHAMTSPRPYRETLSHEEAQQELLRMKGAQFDPRLVDIFVSLLDLEINAWKEHN